MVGSVLLERMRAEGDFEVVEPTFFSTSQAGGTPPDIGRAPSGSAATGSSKTFAPAPSGPG